MVVRNMNPHRETKGRAPTATPERLNLGPMSVKTLDAAKGEFSGYLAYFRNQDYNGDIIEPGAFKKTLNDAREVKSRTNSEFLFPLLWMHDENNPVGGFFDMEEDDKGLFVKGMCDMDTEQGRRAFSGMTKGYMGQMSIGYDTIRAHRDQQGRRHLDETRLWEGSVITTGYAANAMANILATKSRHDIAQKTVSGKTTWPLGERDTAWDGSSAHKRIVSWATNADDSLDQDKMRSVHLWYDGDNPDKVGSYKLLFCDVVGGEVKAMPRGIMACTGSHGIQGTKGISSQEVKAIQGKLSTLYGRMRKEFDDDSLRPSWEETKMSWKREIERKGWGGIQTVTYCLSSIAYLYEQIDGCMEMLGDATGLNLDPDEGEEGETKSVGEQIFDSLSAEETKEVQKAVAVLLKGLPGFTEALSAMGTASQAFDDAIDVAMGIIGMGDEESGYMAVRPLLEVKAGAELSAANKAKLGKVADGLMAHMKTIKNMIGDTEDMSGGAPTATKAVTNASPPEPGATTDTQITDGEPDLTTLLSALDDVVDDAKLNAALAKLGSDAVEGDEGGNN